MKLEIPELCLVLLIGATASGKSTFAKKHFRATEVISSDYCRAVLADDENDQAVTKEAFDLLHSIVAKRLKLGRLVVVDATNVHPSSEGEAIAWLNAYSQCWRSRVSRSIRGSSSVQKRAIAVQA